MTNPLTYKNGKFFTKDGDVLTYKEALKEHGDRVTWFVALWGEVVEKAKERRPPPFPPRVFISYRWNGEAFASWVESLSKELKRLKYAVYLDQWSTIEDPLDAPKFISGLVHCHYIIVVITEEYCRIAKPPGAGHIFLQVPHHSSGDSELDRRLSSDGWVADEFEVITQAEKNGAKVVYCIYDGSRLPEGLEPWRTIDFKISKDVGRISNILPPFRGGVISEMDITKYREIFKLYKEIIDFMEKKESPQIVESMIENLECLLRGIPADSVLNKINEIVLLKGVLDI
jgi:hypothetical protein